MIAQANFTYSPLRKALEKQTKTIENQEEKQIKVIENHRKQLVISNTLAEIENIPFHKEEKSIALGDEILQIARGSY